MISTHDHLRFAALLREHKEYAVRSPGRHLLWLSVREGIIELLERDNHFDREVFVMLTDVKEPE